MTRVPTSREGWGIFTPGVGLSPIWHPRRAQAIREYCSWFDRACFDEAQARAAKGNVFVPDMPLTSTEAAFWNGMRRQKVRAIRVDLVIRDGEVYPDEVWR